jgi:glycosyltransferase involved in cell wall biosynthesis
MTSTAAVPAASRSLPDMNAPLPANAVSTLVEPRRKLRAVAFGGGIGMFPPLMQRLREEFEVVASLVPAEPRLASAWYRLLSIRGSRHASYRAWRYHMEKTPWAFDALTREAGKLLEPLQGQYDVILFFGAMFSPGVLADKPLFVFTDSCRWLSSRNAHDEISHFRRPADARRWHEREARVYQGAARIFVGSDFVRDALVAHYGVDPQRAVTSGFGAGMGFGEPYEKTFDGRTILYIGKGDFEKKGGTLLMRAFERVRREMPDAQLHVVGQDRLPQAEGVVNHGFVRDRAKLVGLMRAAHVFALPSLVDRNPISILEAMATATPCISSDYGAMPEMVGDAGIVAPCGDVDALADALLRILRDAELARAMGERGRLRFERQFNWDSVWQVIQREIRGALA